MFCIGGFWSSTAGEIIEEDIILNNDIADAVHVHMLFVYSLVVEHVVFNGNEAGSIVDLEQIIVVGVVKNVIAENDIFRPDITIPCPGTLCKL